MKKLTGPDTKGKPRKIRDYWHNLMQSTKRSMSLGAQKISKIIRWARKDNWRRGRREKKK